MWPPYTCSVNIISDLTVASKNIPCRGPNFSVSFKNNEISRVLSNFNEDRRRSLIFLWVSNLFIRCEVLGRNPCFSLKMIKFRAPWLMSHSIISPHKLLFVPAPDKKYVLITIIFYKLVHKFEILRVCSSTYRLSCMNVQHHISILAIHSFPPFLSVDIQLFSWTWIYKYFELRVTLNIF